MSHNVIQLTDNVFAFNNIEEQCKWIDFEKAFDKVWRNGIWYKLLLNNMNGNMYNIIVNMHSGTTSCISYNDCKSDFLHV